MLQRIDNETAIVLKELGINEPCSMMYYQGELTGTKMDMYDKPNNYEGFYAAYYQEEVCKIFREKYNIHIENMSSYKHIGIRYDVDVYIKNSSVYYGYNYKTYEEAQLVGIKETIKILKYGNYIKD